MIELRCGRSLHAKFDPDRDVLEVKCRPCSRDAGRPVFHEWPIAEVLDRYHRGEISGVCGPSTPKFVHWRVLH